MVTSRVLVFDPPREVMWDARGVLTAYHGWTIDGDGAGSRVVTEETQRGLLPRVTWWYLRPMLERGHQGWVESLKRMAERGDPDRVSGAEILLARGTGVDHDLVPPDRPAPRGELHRVEARLRRVDDHHGGSVRAAGGSTSTAPPSRSASSSSARTSAGSRWPGTRIAR